MRTILYSLAVLISMSMLTGCAKYTDIIPKGKNLLNRASDLSLLMNINYSGDAFNNIRQSTLVNDMYPQNAHVPNTLSGVLSWNKVLLTYDESADRAALTNADGVYDGLYRIIGTVNIALNQADIASGDPLLLNQIRAEAYIIRAYMHYRLVNIYAKAYDPATAATDGGIPYVKDINFEAVNAKNTVKEVYDNLLKDIEAALALNALPDQPSNGMRAGKGFAYSVKALVLQSLRDYAGSLEAANMALTYNSVLEDHRPLLALPRALRLPTRTGLTAPDNIFYAYNGLYWPTNFSPSYEILSNYYEPGNIYKDSTDVYSYEYGLVISGLPNIPIWMGLYQQNAAGVNTSDVLLIRAEGLIRTNKINEGMDEINKIRMRRVYPYSPLSASTEAEAMAHLQKTSRIELLYTMKNFINIKRWNREGKYMVPVERTINGTKYVLKPDSPLWNFPFPQTATDFNPTLTQNY